MEDGKEVRLTVANLELLPKASCVAVKLALDDSLTTVEGGFELLGGELLLQHFLRLPLCLDLRDQLGAIMVGADDSSHTSHDGDKLESRHVGIDGNRFRFNDSAFDPLFLGSDGKCGVKIWGPARIVWLRNKADSDP